MKRFAVMAIIPLFAGFLFAQDQSRTETRTDSSKSTWNGTLIDAACQNTHTEHRETSRQSNADQTVTTKTETTHTETVDCPVTTATSTFGLLTPEGRFIRFDDPSNTRVADIVKGNKEWSKDVIDRSPLKVSVIGSANGDVALVDSVNPEAGLAVTSGEAGRVIDREPVEPMFDVRYHDDRGKLLVTADGVRFEDISKADRSRTWGYAQIRELKRDRGNEIKIRAYSGGTFEFHLEGPFMSDTVYNMIADRIATRGH
jgi:hypothetical protein